MPARIQEHGKAFSHADRTSFVTPYWFRICGISLLTSANPVVCSGEFDDTGASSFRIGGIATPWTGGKLGDVRMVDKDTIIGRWDVGPGLGWLAALQDCVEPNEGRFGVYFVLSRTA